jgi:hypothetical protein
MVGRDALIGTFAHYSRHDRAFCIPSVGIGYVDGWRLMVRTAPDNLASRRVIVANGGQPDARRRGQDRFWIDL